MVLPSYFPPEGGSPAWRSDFIGYGLADDSTVRHLLVSRSIPAFLCLCGWSQRVRACVRACVRVIGAV